MRSYPVLVAGEEPGAELPSSCSLGGACCGATQFLKLGRSLVRSYPAGVAGEECETFLSWSVIMRVINTPAPLSATYL